MGNVDFSKDLYNWDNEDNILNYMQVYLDGNYLLLNNNDFERQILECLKDYRSFTPNSGHECLPPDYYSDSLNCMFDVFRINATEEIFVNKKRGTIYNPVKVEERRIIKSYEDIGFYGKPYTSLLVDVHGQQTFDKYKRQAHRTISNHIRKIPIWEREHPRIKTKGLVICDESSLCIEGVKEKGITHFNPDSFRIHETWNDFEFSQLIYESDLDFIVWFNPVKRASKFIYIYNQNYYPKSLKDYPPITIVDTRISRKSFRCYDYSQLIFV